MHLHSIMYLLNISFPPCPLSLFKDLDHSNPELQVWLDSYNKEKQGIIYHEVYGKISKIQYLTLKRSGNIPKAIPSLCVLVVKNDKDGKPLCAKSHIVVLGNFEDQIYQKSQRYAPVLRYSSFCLLTAKSISDKHILQQGYCKNVLFNAKLLDDEVMVIRPPIGKFGFSRR